MNIVTLIKQVPETSSVRLDPDTGTMLRSEANAIINPLDLYAIESTIDLISRYGGKSTAISMGPAKAQSAIREAIAMGINSGILLSDSKFAGSDTWATSHIISHAIKQVYSKIGYDLIICGERATDGDTGQVGPGIAAMLNLPIITYVSSIVSVADGLCTCHRMVEDGYQILEVQLPAVITVVKEIGVPRLPTLRLKQRSRTAEITTLTAATLQLSDQNIGLKGSPTQVIKISRPKVQRTCTLIRAKTDDQIDAATDRVIEVLRKENLL